MRIITLFVLTACLALSLSAHSQSKVPKADSTLRNTAVPAAVTDSGKVKKAPPAKQKPAVVKDAARIALEKMPKQAALRSAIIPGWGQLRNKRWWKVPLVYGGYVSLGLTYNFYQQNYRETLKEVQYRLAHDRQKNNPKFYNIEFEGMVSSKDFYRRNRDLSILGFALMHTIQIIDAYVDAKFFRYDISGDLSLKVQPSVQTTPYVHASVVPVPSMKITLSL